jgi:hypothetical protein
MGSKIGLASDRGIPDGWSWGGDGIGDHSLYDRDGLTVARFALDGDRYELRSPVAWPRQSWPRLDAAKRGAVSLALAALPYDRALAARLMRENGEPNPMGPPLNRSLAHGDLIASSKITEGKRPGDAGEIPGFHHDRSPSPAEPQTESVIHLQVRLIHLHCYRQLLS